MCGKWLQTNAQEYLAEHRMQIKRQTEVGGGQGKPHLWNNYTVHVYKCGIIRKTTINGTHPTR